jgi:AcrR family transcriptional regulator
MTKEELSTREKILTIAHSLFAEKGVNGVGVREIAKEADVNVAAINYHFGNKDSLYAETIKFSMEKTKNDIENLYKELGENVTTEELSKSIYNYFITNKEDLNTGFKLFLTAGDNFQEDLYEHDEQEIGPPGGVYLYQTLKKEAPHADDKDIIWGVRAIFTQLLHKALLICNHCEVIQSKYGVGADDFLEDTTRLVKIVVEEVKKSS